MLHMLAVHTMCVVRHVGECCCFFVFVFVLIRFFLKKKKPILRCEKIFFFRAHLTFYQFHFLLRTHQSAHEK